MFLKKISLCVMTLLFASVAANAQNNTSSNIGSLVEVHKFDDITTNIYRYPFASLEWTDPSGGLALSGTQAKRNVRFEIRKDELVTGGALELYYTPSPALIPVRSHLNVYFNGLLIKSLPILCCWIHICSPAPFIWNSESSGLSPALPFSDSAG